MASRYHTLKQLFAKIETDPLLNFIRTMGLSSIASFSGMKARDIITYSKCDLCRKLFNCPDTLTKLRDQMPQLAAWSR